MLDTEPGAPRTPEEDIALAAAAAQPDPTEDGSAGLSALREDVAALVDDARTYAEAEIAFQKTRAGLAGKHGARALLWAVLALLLLHIALITFAVGAVMALAPLVTIWGAIAIVVGALLVATALLGLKALRNGKMLSAMFGSGDAR